MRRSTTANNNILPSEPAKNAASFSPTTWSICQLTRLAVPSLQLVRWGRKVAYCQAKNDVLPLGPSLTSQSPSIRLQIKNLPSDSTPEGSWKVAHEKRAIGRRLSLGHWHCSLIRKPLRSSPWAKIHPASQLERHLVDNGIHLTPIQILSSIKSSSINGKRLSAKSTQQQQK